MLSLLEVADKKAEIGSLLPVVEYAVLQKLKKKQADYWDYATLLELEIIRGQEHAAKGYLVKALACTIENEWMFDTTIKNISMIRRARVGRNEDATLTDKMVSALEKQLEIFRKKTIAAANKS